MTWGWHYDHIVDRLWLMSPIGALGIVVRRGPFTRGHRFRWVRPGPKGAA